MAIISGRPRRTLEEWFGKLPISLIAEHGVWLRNQGADWRMLKDHDGGLEGARAPDSATVTWTACRARCWRKRNFRSRGIIRRADPEQASLRAKELLDDLAGYTRNIDVQVFEGNKVIEIRNTGVNKGTAGLEWLKQFTPDFILGIGDDWTDEDLFRALPPTAFSVRVGAGQHGGALLFERPGDRAADAARIERSLARKNCRPSAEPAPRIQKAGRRTTG